ncbi:hypothetical protein D3C85_939670 [compost metagenome]
MVLRNITIFIIIMLTCSCGKIKQHDNSSEVKFDTINKPKNLKQECDNVTNGYKKKFGAYISNYFEITDEMVFDINNDNKLDTLAILTPAPLIPGELSNKCTYGDETYNRLLVVFKNTNGINSTITIFKDVISNQVSIAWGGSEGFKQYKNGFILKKSSGQGCKFDYSIFINTLGKEAVVDSINLSSFCPSGNNFKERKINFEKTKMLKDFNRKIIDSIKVKYDL